MEVNSKYLLNNKLFNYTQRTNKLVRKLYTVTFVKLALSITLWFDFSVGSTMVVNRKSSKPGTKRAQFTFAFVTNCATSGRSPDSSP